MKKRAQLDLQLRPDSNAWTKVRLGDIAEVRLGRQRSPSRAVGDHMRPYMRAANVTWRGISVEDVKEMDFTPIEAESYELKNGDILLSEASGSPHEVGKPAIWRDEVPGACFQNTLIRVRAPTPMVRYLHLHFLRDALIGRFASASRGVGIHHLGAKTLDDWSVDVPPIGEQQRICDAVDEHLTKLDAAVAGLERVQANLKRYRASVLKAAVEGRLVPTEAELARQEGREYEPASVLLQRILVERRRRWEEAELAKMKAKGKTPRDDSWKEKYPEPAAPDTKGLPTLPEGWSWASIDQVSQVVQYGTSAKTSSDGDVPVLRMGNIVEGSLSLNDLKFLTAEHHEFPELILRTGDLLFNRTNSPELVGKSAVYHGTPPRCSFASYLIRVVAVPPISPDYISAWINSYHGRTWVAAVRVQQVGQANVNGTKLRQATLPVPPVQEQLRILEELSRAFSVIDDVATDVSLNRARSQRLRQSILKWAFEGKLVDQDPNDEPASALLARIRAERESTPTAPRPRKTSPRAKKASKKS